MAPYWNKMGNCLEKGMQNYLQPRDLDKNTNENSWRIIIAWRSLRKNKQIQK